MKSAPWLIILVGAVVAYFISVGFIMLWKGVHGDPWVDAFPLTAALSAAWTFWLIRRPKG